MVPLTPVEVHEVAVAPEVTILVAQLTAVSPATLRVSANVGANRAELSTSNNAGTHKIAKRSRLNFSVTGISPVQLILAG